MTSRQQRRGPCFGQRHILILCLFLGNVVDYCMRSNLSVAIVAMVNTDINTANVSSECPSTSINTTRASAPPGEKFAWSKQLQGLVLSSFYWGYFVLQIPAGILAQRYGAKWIFGVSILMTAVLTLLTPLFASISVYLLIAVRALEGLIRGVSYPTMMAMLGRWVPPQETSFLTTVADFGSTVGTVVGQLSAGALCASAIMGGWPSVFYTGGAVAALWFLPWCLLAFDTPESHPRISEEEKQYIHDSIGTDQQHDNEGGVPWRGMLTSRGAWAFIIALTFNSWIFFTLLTCLPQFMSEVLHFNISDDGMISSLPYMVSLVTSCFFSFIGDKVIASNRFKKTHVRKFFTTIAYLGCGSCIFGVTVVSRYCDRDLTILLLVLGTAFSTAVYAGYYVNMLDIAPEYAGTLYGIGNTLATFTGIVSPIITDYITQNKTIEEWNFVFYITSGVSLTIVIVYLILGSSERENWKAATNATENNEDTEPILEVNADGDRI